MNTQIHGAKRRPRIVLAGEFSNELVQEYMNMFPTVFHAKNLRELTDEIHPKEIDILIISHQFPMNMNVLRKYVEATNVICFSIDPDLRLPGPTQDTNARTNVQITSEEYITSSLTLQLNRVREIQLKETASIKNWMSLSCESTIVVQNPLDKKEKKEKDKLANQDFIKAAFIRERHEEKPLAVIYRNSGNNMNYAWLPNSYSHQIEWVKAIVTEWAKEDIESFPDFGDWTTKREWMTVEEENLAKRIEELEEKKVSFIQEINDEIYITNKELETKRQLVNNSKRKLLTEQGDALVDEVSNAFSEIGFNVLKMDNSVKEGNIKKEDLRLSLLINDSTWEAIVEVRGYARSGFQTTDITRLSRFAGFYLKEKGEFPDKRIYVVNGQIDLHPPNREKPFSSAPDDLEVFSEDGGLVIWTVDLYKSMKKLKPTNKELFRDSIVKSTGYWSGI